MAGHDDRAGHIRRIQAQVGDEGFGEALDRKLGSRIGGMRHAGAKTGPEAIDAADVHQMAARAGHQHRQEGARPEIHAEPDHIESPLPLAAITGHKTATAADAGVIEEQIDVLCLMLDHHLLAKGDQIGLFANVGHTGGDPRAGRRTGQAQLAGLRHRVGRQVADRDMHALCAELSGQRASNTGAAAGDDCDLIGFDVHVLLRQC